MTTILPFSSHLQANNGARELIARDKERASKLLAGLHPHGPLGNQRKKGHAAAVTEQLRRKHGHSGGHSSGGTLPSQPSSTAPPPTSDDSVDVTDAGVTYTASVGVGSPPTQYTLLIDTGEFLTSQCCFYL